MGLLGGCWTSIFREKMVFVFIWSRQNYLSQYHAIISYFSCLPNRKVLSEVKNKWISKGVFRNPIFFEMDAANLDKIAKIRGKTEEILFFFCPKYLPEIVRNTDFCPKFHIAKFLAINVIGKVVNSCSFLLGKFCSVCIKHGRHA